MQLSDVAHLTFRSRHRSPPAAEAARQLLARESALRTRASPRASHVQNSKPATCCRLCRLQSRRRPARVRAPGRSLAPDGSQRSSNNNSIQIHQLQASVAEVAT